MVHVSHGKCMRVGLGGKESYQSSTKTDPVISHNYPTTGTITTSMDSVHLKILRKRRRRLKNKINLINKKTTNESKDTRKMSKSGFTRTNRFRGELYDEELRKTNSGFLKGSVNTVLKEKKRENIT